MKIAHLWFQQSFELKNEQIIYSHIANIKNTGFSKELQLTGTKKKSKKKAKKLQEVFSEKYEKYQGRDYNGSVSSRPLFVMRASDPEPVYVELANIRNQKDRERIILPQNRQILADWLMEGFLK